MFDSVVMGCSALHAKRMSLHRFRLTKHVKQYNTRFRSFWHIVYQKLPFRFQCKDQIRNLSKLKQTKRSLFLIWSLHWQRNGIIWYDMPKWSCIYSGVADVAVLHNSTRLFIKIQMSALVVQRCHWLRQLSGIVYYWWFFKYNNYECLISELWITFQFIIFLQETQTTNESPADAAPRTVNADQLGRLGAASWTGQRCTAPGGAMPLSTSHGRGRIWAIPRRAPCQSGFPPILEENILYVCSRIFEWVSKYRNMLNL